METDLFGEPIAAAKAPVQPPKQEVVAVREERMHDPWLFNPGKYTVVKESPTVTWVFKE